MQSLNINQLVVEGLAPLSYASQHVVHHILDMNILDEPSINDISQLSIQTLTSCLFKSDVSIPYDDFFQQSISSSSNNIAQTILTHSSFLNKNITILLRSALIYGTASFSRTLRDFKITHKKVFAQELNQYDKHQNTLLWYLTVGGLYSSIEELYRLASVELLCWHFLYWRYNSTDPNAQNLRANTININVKNGPFNQTILHYAVIHENMEKIRIILNIGTDTNLRDRFGRTALHYLALYGTKDNNNVEIGKLLMTHGILPNLEDNICRTSLHLAIIKKNYDLVEYLITLPNINVCIRDKQGYTVLCYLCQHILNLSDISLENNQCIEQIFQIINLIIDRCPSDKLSDNFHITNNNKLEANLLLHVYNKINNLILSLPMNTLFHRLEPIIIGTDQDHCLFVERLLDLHSWKSAVYALCNTHNVNISNALIQCIANDPHILLINNISPLSDLSIVFVLIFYSLAINMTLLRNVVPMCKYVLKNEQKMKSLIDDKDESCDFYIENYNLHTNYVTFIHTCLHYASSNVFSLKHLCRYYIRHCFKSDIINKIEKCPYLKLKHCEYLKLNELLLIYSKIHDLSFVIYLIKRLYNIHHIDEYNLFENEINDNLKRSSQLSIENIDIFTTSLPVDTSSNNDIVQSVFNNEYDIRIEYIKHVSQTSIKDINPSLETNHKSILSISDDDEISTELVDMQTKSKDIEEMIEKFLLKK